MPINEDKEFEDRDALKLNNVFPVDNSDSAHPNNVLAVL
jgi:hypothetical protein